MLTYVSLVLVIGVIFFIAIKNVTIRKTILSLNLLKLATLASMFLSIIFSFAFSFIITTKNKLVFINSIILFAAFTVLSTMFFTWLILHVEKKEYIVNLKNNSSSEKFSPIKNKYNYLQMKKILSIVKPNKNKEKKWDLEKYIKTMEKGTTEQIDKKESNIIEKSVDSEENIDTIGIDNDIKIEIELQEEIENNSNYLDDFKEELIYTNTEEEVEEVKEVQEVEEVEEAEAVQEVEEVEEAEAVQEVEEAEAVQEVEEVEEVEEVQKVEDVETVEDVEEVQKVEEKNEFEDNIHENAKSEENYNRSNKEDSYDISSENDEVYEIINTAFELKEEGRFEESIEKYMVGLDKNPEEEVVFWIILDICTLYKKLGQSELAKYVLESYTDMYGHIMSDKIKSEIQKNLE